MAKLSELELKNEIVQDDQAGFEDLPEQIGGAFPDPPQPGSFRVRFPSPQALSESWEKIEPEVGERVVSVLRGAAALTIVQSAGGRYNGDALETRISNAERRRGKDETKKASDMDYALVATKYQGKKPKFGDNKAYADAFLSVANKEIGIDWEFGYYCNPKKPIRVPDPNNANQTVVLDGKDGTQVQNGCDTRYYQKDVERVPDAQGNMQYPVRLECQCGAVLRAMGQIARFRE